MSNSGLDVVCRSCSRKVKMEQVKFDDVRKAYVCEGCFALSHRVEKSFSRDPLVDDAVRSVASLKSNMIKYTCRKCKYHFARSVGKEISVCPYCGSSSLDVLNNSANKIISESSNFF